jgi:hypothetical protein
MPAWMTEDGRPIRRIELVWSSAIIRRQLSGCSRWGVGKHATVLLWAAYHCCGSRKTCCGYSVVVTNFNASVYAEVPVWLGFQRREGFFSVRDSGLNAILLLSGSFSEVGSEHTSDREERGSRGHS